MRRNGVRALAVYCGAIDCHHGAVLDVEEYPDELPVPAFGPSDAVHCLPARR
jgi:hypothetical protein